MYVDLYINDFFVRIVKGVILFILRYWEKFYIRYDRGRFVIVYNNFVCMFIKIKILKWYII